MEPISEGQYEEHVLIPKLRVGVLIGKKGETKRQIEMRTKTTLFIDAEGKVTIRGDSLALLHTVPLIRAIGRGFNPEKAFMLLQDEYVFEIIELKDYAGKSKKRSLRLKSRVIGSEGAAKNQIEEMTHSFISVSGKTIAIIGPSEGAFIARKAIEMILEGSQHSTAFRYIEKKLRMIRGQQAY